MTHPNREFPPYYPVADQSHRRQAPGTYWPEYASSYPNRRPRRRSRFIRFMLVVFGAVRTQPILSAGVFMFVLACGFVWWCSRPFIWQTEAAIIVAQPQDDEFIDFLRSRSGATASSANRESLTALNTNGSKGFRLLSPSDLGELLTTPSLVERARVELDAKVANDPGHHPERPGEILFSAVADGRQVIRRQTGAHWSRLIDLLTGTTSAPAPDQSTLEVRLADEQDGDNHVLRLHVESSNPVIAQQAAQHLVDLSRTRLSEFESSKITDHLHELEPQVKSAQADYEASRQALDSYRSSLDSANPDVQVKIIEAQRERAIEENANVGTQISEAEAERMSVMQQIGEIRSVGDAYVVRQVTAENPRIAEIKREISELQSEYDALVDYTDRHPEKQAILQQINRKRGELDALPPTIVVEEVTEPNPLFAQLEQRRLDLDRTITQLAGRELAVTNRLNELNTQLSEAREQALMLGKLTDSFEQARATYEELDNQLSYLLMNIAQKEQFDHIRLMEEPRVRSTVYPDQPRGLLVLLITLGCAVMISAFVATLRSGLKARIVSRSQIDDLAVDVPIVVVGHLPARPVRRLLPAKVTG